MGSHRYQICQAKILGFPISRTVRNKYFVYKLPVYGIFVAARTDKTPMESWNVISSPPFILYHYSVYSLAIAQCVPPEHKWKCIGPGRHTVIFETHGSGIYLFSYISNTSKTRVRANNLLTLHCFIQTSLNLYYLDLNFSFTNNKTCEWCLLFELRLNETDPGLTLKGLTLMHDWILNWRLNILH